MERFKLSYTRTRRQKIIMSLAAIIVFVTTYALILPAITIDTDTAEIEPGMAVGTVETVDLPAASLQESVEGITVSVEAEAGVFPENTSMNLRVEDDKSLQPLLEAAVEGKVDRFEAVDISFADENGEPVSPQDTYSVKMISDSMEEKADRVLVKVSGEAATVVEDPEFTYKQVAFDATEDATYVIVEKSELTTEYLSADGNLYEVNVTYDYTAQIPDGARLTVSECDEDSSAYESSRRAFLSVREAEEDAPEENELFMDIVDISIVAEDGSPVEPMAPVQVTVRRKTLPDDFDSAGGSLLVQHLNNSGEKPFVEAIDAAVLISGDTLTANFTADSFSYYAFTWNPTSSQYRTVRIHYGYKDANNRFYEFDSSLLKQTPQLSQSNEYAYLIYDVEGYKFDTAYYNNTNASSSPTNNNNHPTISGSNYSEIDPLLRYNDSRWRYWNGSEWYPLSYGSNTNRYSDIYVCYEPLEEPTLGGTAKPYEQFENPQRPSMSKTSENNHDGTRTITLSVDGDRTPVLHEKLADVIVVFDRSGSMKYNMDGSQTSNVATANQRITTAVRAVGDLADELLSQEYYNKDGRPQIRMSLVTFSNDAQAETLATDSPIMVDGEYWQHYPDYNFTTNATKYKNMLSGVTADGGTNWEQALQIANRMEVDPDRDTFVIFVTDGDPTFRMTRSPTTNNSDATIKGDTFTSGNTVYSYYRDYDVFGQGNNDSSGFNYAAALAEAQSIVAQHKKLYCIAIGAEGSVTKMQRLADEAGAEGVFEADDEDSLNAAFRDIKESIVAHYGWNNVDIVDGITTMTNLSAKANVVGADYDELTYTKIVHHEGADDEVIPDWNPLSEGCQLAGYNEESGALEWNMGPNFQLKKNCTYQVSFKVWPNQDAIDLVTKLNNHEITLDDLTEEEASQFAVVQQDGYDIYTLKTNTDVGMTYTLSKEDGDGVHPIGDPVYEPCNDEVDPLVMQTMPMSVHKEFNDSFGDEDGDGIGEDRPSEVVLYLYRRDKGDPNAQWEEVNVIEQPDGTFSNRITLNDTLGWETDTFWVAPGLVDKDGVTRELGHEYWVTEDELDYHYQLDGEKLNPLFLGQGDMSDTSLDYVESLTGTRLVYLAKDYNGDLDETKDLTAINVVKGGINLKKYVVDPTDPQVDSREFTIRGWILDPDGNPYTFDPALDDRTDRSQKATADTPLFAEHQNDPVPYHYYSRPDETGKRTRLIYKGHFADTSNIEFTIKNGEEVRFPIIPIGSTYCFWEVDEDGMPTNYVLDHVVAQALDNMPNPVGGGYTFVPSADTSKYPTVDANNRVTGEIDGNTLEQVEFYNRLVRPGSIIARKIVTKSDGVTQIYPDEEFTFQVRIRRNSYSTTGLTNVPYIIWDKDGNQVRTGTFSNTAYSRNCEFTLKAGQYIEIPNVPDGAVYRVQENAVAGSGYTLASVTGSAASSDGHTVTSPPVVDQSQLDRVNGTMHSDEEHSALFENRIDRDPTELQLIKKDKKDGSRINGVTFMLYTDANHTTEATDYQGNAINPLVTGGFADEDQTIPLGLAAIGNVWPGTYYLVETGPPNGYQPLSDHVTITVGNDGTVTVVNPDDASSTGAGAIPAINGIVTIEIPNTKYSDMVLPSTGGIGTHLFYISGGLLLTAAAGIYIFSYRRRKGGKRRPDFP